MRDIRELLTEKESELERVRKEIQSLHAVIPLLEDERPGFEPGERGRGHQVGFTRAEAVSRPRKVVERLISKKGISHPSCFFCKGG